MISNNYIIYSVKIIEKILIDIIYFPVWWYSRGLLNLFFKLKKFLYNKQRSLAILVWIKNIFKPMYGQYDFAGILISFFVRSFQIIFRSIVMLFWIIFAVIVFCSWVILPILVAYEIIFQLI